MSTSYPYAGFWKRVGAFVIDSIILSIPIMVLYVIWGLVNAKALPALLAADQASPMAIAPILLRFYAGIFLLQLLSLVLFWLYNAWMESSRHQATWGKRLVGIKVVGAQGNPLTFWHATGRNLGKFISSMTLYIGFLMAGANAHKQALHDVIASAYVVDKDYQEGQPLPEVKTHYVLFGFSVAGLLLFFLLPFILVFFLAFSEAAMNNNAALNNRPAVNSARVEQIEPEELLTVSQHEQDTRALARLTALNQLPKEQQQPFTEDEYDYSFLDDGTVRAQRSENASFALLMRPDTNWPCCQPLVPDGCEQAANVSVCQAD